MQFLILPFLFLGIITPFSYSAVLINALIFGLLSAKAIMFFPLKKRNIVLFLTTAIYGLILYLQWPNSKSLLAVLVFLSVNLLFKKITFLQKNLIFLVLGLLVFGIFITIFSDGRNLKNYLNEIPQEHYQTDMASYLKTYYLLKENKPFYPSFADPIKDRLEGHYPGEIWGWKQPFLFYLWRIVPGRGSSILYLLGVFFALDLIAAYFIAKKFIPGWQALLSPFLLYPYFHYPLVSDTALQVEWWAVSFFIWGLTAYLYDKKLLAGILFAICLAVRELFAIPILFLLLINILKKDYKGFIKLALPTAVVFIPYYIFFHTANVLNFESSNSITQSLLRTNAASGWHLVRTTLAFGSWSYALYLIRPFILMLLFTTVFLFFAIIKTKNKNKIKQKYIALLASFLPFFLISLKLPMLDAWHDYWGIYYIPLLLIATPIVFVISPSRRGNALTLREGEAYFYG